MRRISIINQKGGVGKTTTAVNLGAGLAAIGKRVLLLDLDPQANLTLHLDVDPTRVSASIYDVLRGERPLEAVIRRTSIPGVCVVPAHIDLAGAESELASEVGRETLLRDALNAYAAKTSGPAAPVPTSGFVDAGNAGADGEERLVFRSFDYLVIDCPPSLGFLSINGLTAAHEVLVPLQTQFFALQGMTKLLEVVRLVRKRLNPHLRLLGIVPCLYDSRTKLSQEVVDEVSRHFGNLLLKTKIRPNIKLAEAPSHGKTIFQYAPDSRGALDYLQLAREVAGEAIAEAASQPPSERPASEARSAAPESEQASVEPSAPKKTWLSAIDDVSEVSEVSTAPAEPDRAAEPDDGPDR